MLKFKKSILVLISCLAMSTVVFAHGKNDVEDITAENMNSWQEEFDLDSKKPGKYNIMITARDLGGNTLIAGPHNIYYDPESDLPVCGITNPYPNMRVVGNLNIVGTCVDDDGVSRVDLILDEGAESEKHVTAEGKEFWSYYLDTNSLEEGPHTIKVIGYDINDEPVEGHPTLLTWQLDRKQPLTQVLDKSMGVLVSGNVKFDGIVSDGNGIKSLEYSVDNGTYFNPVKITKNKAECDFTVTIDTRKFEDGPAVLWFRAVDNAGSVGLYSFLYFIDNTKPDVAIVSPTPDEVVNGRFTVAGYAKDKIGVTELSWTCGNESGTFDLIPGNPYWAVTLDTTGSKDKNRKFTIHAVDRATNVVDVTQTINLDQELDKPIVTPASPEPGQIFGDDAVVFVRGIVSDDDAVQSVKIQLDAEEPIIQETKGVYYYELTQGKNLTPGKHKVTISGIDVNGVEGNPVVTEIVSIATKPEFGEATVTRGKETVPFEVGMEIHPESNSVFSIPVTSPVGIKHIHTMLTWGRSGLTETAVDLKNVASYNVSFPILSDSPKGVMKYTVQVTDSSDRVTEYNTFYYVTNTSLVKNDDPIIIFDDSTVSEDGSIVNNSAFPCTGYLLGGNAASVEIVPETPFATAKLNGNQIILVPGNAIGSSEKVVVKVTTDKGKVAESQPLVFKADNELPKISIDRYQEDKALDGRSGSVSVSGNVTCKTGVGVVKYRILSVKTEIKNAVIAAVKADPVPEDFQPIKIDEEGKFDLNLSTTDLGYGMFVVEIIAESAGGNQNAKAFAISTIPDIEEVNGKMPVAKAPVITFVDGFDVYGLVSYQGDVSRTFQTFARADMVEGNNPIVMETTTPADEKLFTGKFTAVKNPTLAANFALVNDETYKSGMSVVVPYASKEGGKVSIFIDTGAVVNSVSYTIYGNEVAGGDLTQTGNAKLIKPTEDEPMRWIAEIPLINLPSRVTKIEAKIKAGSLEKTISGSVTVVRENGYDIVDDSENFYGLQAADTIYDTQTKTYILGNGSVYYYYTNFTAPIKAEIVGTDGLKATVNGKLVTISSVKDGNYKDVVLKITDRFGDVYESSPVNFIADSSDPVLNVATPKFKDWLAPTVKVSGTVADPLGIKSVEYSLDNGVSWKNFTLNLPSLPGTDAQAAADQALGVTFDEDVNISTIADGLLQLNIRATDNAGHISSFRTSCFKDTTAPEVKVVEPLNIDVINGETLIVFDAKDNGFLQKAEYVTPPVEGSEQTRYNVDLDPLISTFIGTEKCPNEESMSFIFTDDAGNATTIEKWDFNIDNQSDLPVCEIHVPEDMQVITRDFTISGVVYDDDGESSIFFKIDDGEYQKLPEMGTSFAIDVPLRTMTDNEHTVTVYAVDINGVKGEETTKTFRISLEEPKGAVELPTIDTSVREMVTISGWASDKNDISKVEISLDNGCSYNDAVGTTEWSYTVDTRAIPGGTQVVFLRVTDGYGIQGLYSSLINIDNDAPNLNLELPLDDTTTTGTLFFSGHSYDNVEVTDLYLSIRRLDAVSEVVTIPFNIERIIGQTVDMTQFEDGFYNIELTSTDKAGNVTNVSRNIHLDKSRPPATVDVLYPLNGEHKNGVFTIYGQTSAEAKIISLKLYIDEKLTSETEVTDCGFFKFDMSPENISEGTHTYRVDAVLDTGMQVPSREQTITYSPIGPWVTIDNFTYGDFATNRPFLRGQAGYSISEDELLLSKTKEASPEFKAAVAAKKVAKVEISFDNGKTFTLLSNNEKWMYRIENQDLPEGYHFFLIRATMMNGETAITRIIIQIDNTNPSINLIAPVIGGRYNQKLTVSGLSHDDVRLEDVTITLRKGDKSSYEVPSFIQGLYLDFHFWGATLFDIGAGLTFFDDVVKLQVSWGQFTQEQRDAASGIFGIANTDLRYGGDNVLSAKVLANIFELPFSYLFGHDWDWLYAQVAIGAEFSRFNVTNSGKPQILSAPLVQLEFPKVKLQGVKAFSTFSLYTEGALWFIPTDVTSTVDIENMVPQIAVGARINIF